MHRRVLQSLPVVTLSLLLGSMPLIGCKKAAAPEPAAAVPSAPGGAEVAAAMAKQEAFRSMLKSVAGELRGLGIEDPKAKEAFNTVSRLGAGR